MKRKACFLLIAITVSCGSACKKFVQVNPPTTSLVSTNVYSNDASASAAMLGLYNSVSAASRLATLFDMYAGMQADELTNYNVNTTIFVQFYRNSLNSNNAPFWSELYNDVFFANSVLEGLSNSSGLTSDVKSQLMGEALFMRGFFYFYLVNLFGNVPLVTSASSYQANDLAPRSSTDSVYGQIVDDLIAAKALLSTNFVGPDAITVSTERTRPTRWAAGALLARVYLYMKQWEKAENEADSVIGNTTQFGLLTNLNQVFLANSNEAIWQLQPVTAGYNTMQAHNFILTTKPGTGTAYVAMSPELDSAFNPLDNRLTAWVGKYANGGQTWYYPYKYKANKGAVAGTEYLMVLRLAEQYLIRAEARAEQNNLTGGTGAINDLNVIRVRAGLPGYTASADQDSVLSAIANERRIELFTEWGHRWLDLVRTGAVGNVLGSPGNVLLLKGGSTWNADYTLYPLPFNDLQIDGNLVQNPGY